ncbi:ABC transporter substrate-binding protein [Tetragenococcus koreensis]|uniref:Branched-chain amino acid ABC transporter substrate-binding protein n=1 Tax=Tetragenococcus koreensis TaxID=290335 RepID=A0AAN4UCC9_9ENTE|nr:ABC transporter substrate-binding protein [Tetragenococcus koreensis]AYW45390.1 branched-chain amino acid ABC transporter substrate-binding protein [Tetragenococcus koreensis]MCF1584766.1 ABC transporter substrate-binding protein [Tetragenococcus koreensis]MCF1614382.1 ABC transporter substrate-binding protein [Tetragenococcus koreensis]MCF1618093.1 ABC transporter substrate-binding protein [Tetragenococcus koreensis]MCF1620048.1 ABC transporter substrate-binding protein [Tetragenococcus ko
MKKKFAFLFVGLFFLSACSAGPSGGSAGAAGDNSNAGNQQEGDTIKVGLNLELSGAVAGYGAQEEEGAELAVEKINEDGGILGKDVELVTKDNKSDNNEAATTAANLTTNDNIVAMIGPATSGAVKAAIPNVTKAQVPMVTPSGTDDSITVSNDQVQEYIFRSCFQDSFQGVILAKYATDNLEAEKTAILGDNSSDYATGLTKAFTDEYDGDIVAQENFTKGDKDFQAALTKLKETDFDVLYVPGYYEEAGLIIKQAREMGIEQPIIGADGFGDEKMIELAGEENVSNVFYTGHFSALAPANDTVEPFIDDFKGKYDKEPSTFNALSYDAMLMIKAAIENEDSADSTDIAKGLAELQDFVGVTGNISVDQDHNPEKPLVVVGFTDGEESSAETIEP